MRKRKYGLNENFFKNPSEWGEPQAYILGWILSDGHINKKSNCVSIKLQEKDIGILKLIKESFGYEGPITTEIRNGSNFKGARAQNRAVLNIHSSEIKLDLNRLGFNNEKGKNLIFPKFLRDDLLSHFIRGFFDGDGCISYSFSGDRMLSEFNLVSTKSFCLSLGSILNTRDIIIKGHGVVFENGALTLRGSGNLNSIKLLIYLYKDASMFLERKRKKFEDILNFCEERAFFKEKYQDLMKSARNIFNT